MTKYTNSACDAHRNVTTSEPVCIICMDKEIDSLRKDAKRYKWLRKNGKPAAEGLVMRNPNLWDEAIDAAMNGANA